jgi:glycosyltransferase involved in cell wall biosynthesis
MDFDRTKKKVLVFIDWFLPGTKAGGPVRSCVNLIDQLGDEFDFSVVTRDADYTETKAYPDIRSNEWNVRQDGKRVYYISNDQLNRKTIRDLLLSEKFDAVYLNGIWSQPFTVWPLEELNRMNSTTKRVLAVRGMLAPSAMAIKSLKKKAFLFYAGIKKTYADVLFHCTNEKEQNNVFAVFGLKSKTHIAGNMPRKIQVAAEVKTKKSNSLRLINIARIAPEKNTVFAIEALAEVKVPITVDFYGTVYDTAYFEQCKIAVAKLPAHIDFHFRGVAPSDSIRELIASYDLFFMPTRGENFGHVILESLQTGTPVLISDQTPWRNLENQKAGWDLPLINAPIDFASKIEMVQAMKNEQYKEYREGALAMAERYTSKAELLEKNRTLFR